MDICECRVAFATEKLDFFVEMSSGNNETTTATKKDDVVGTVNGRRYPHRLTLCSVPAWHFPAMTGCLGER